MGVKKGDILPRRPLMDRFWEKVVKTDSCWLWTSATRHWGYGCIWSGGGKGGKGSILVAHRVAYEAIIGPIPEGKVLDHICKVPCCVNPSHLRVCEPRENYVDFSDSPLAANARKTHCAKGHPLTPENIAIVKREPKITRNGNKTGRVQGRVCLTCFPTYWRHAVIPRERPPGSKVMPNDPDYALLKNAA